jgi:sporulation protein YlmC with PRC-barrel domain
MESKTASTTSGTDATETGAATGGPKLISSNKVQGTEVYGPNGEHVGEIDRLMIERVSGRVAYAVMSFGGFLGMGKDFYPIPWNSLKYDTTLDGYRTDITKEQVQGAPAHAAGETFDWNDDEWHSRVHEHYKTKPTYRGYL